MRTGLCAIVLLIAAPLTATPHSGSFNPATPVVEAYDFAELTVNVAAPAANPFTDVTLSGSFGKTGEVARVPVEGFCDSSDGSLFKIRFVPTSPGDYTYQVAYHQGAFEKSATGTFHATDGHRRGPIRVDKSYPWHFVWEGTGEHYFFNGTTAFWIAGWRDDRVIESIVDRLRRLKVNRIRALVNGSANIYWGEPVMTGDNFSMMLRPWVSKDPDSFDRPGIDYTRFNVAYWQKWERMARYARDRDVIVSAIIDISTHSTQATSGSDDERRYIRYAVARLSAFSNVTWDLGDDLDSFRDETWAHATGTLIEQWDPYRHLATSHPVNREHQDRASDWFGFTSIQEWSRNQHDLMLEERQIQMKTGRIIPQINEEYGYEDHYPHWAPKPDGDSAETLRRTAWEIAMAGAYGTAGESARRGINIWPDTGGGWINGRGDDTMVMLKGYEHMVDFFTSFEWWKTEPHDELVNSGAYCLAQPGEIYAVYLPKEGTVTVKREAGAYEASWFSAFTGETIPLPPIQGPEWTSPKSPGWLDWAILFKKKE